MRFQLAAAFSGVLLLTSLARADSVLYVREMHQRDLRNFTTVKNLVTLSDEASCATGD